MNFEESRGKILEEIKEKNERVMKHFFHKIECKAIIGYENDTSKNIFTIWTDKPGIIIGECGKNVNILKDILKKEFEKDYDVKFKEIKGGMLVIV